MSITLVTGVPGSGKTLYAVSKLLKDIQGAKVSKTLEDGSQVDIDRVIYTNVNGYQKNHEPIEGGGVWTYTNKDWAYEGNPEGLRNWHKWAKPGAYICFDEFQKFWPPRPNGAPVPPDIQTLDTHRHMGVDFLLITQNCANVDRHILGLVDRHLHVRRVANLPFATVYEWDHASKTLNYKNSMAKTPWRYDKSAFKDYKSAELHTKQKRKMPAMVWFVLAGLCGAAYAFPTLKTRLTDRVNGGHSVPAAEDAKQANKKTFINENGQTVTVETTTPEPGAVPPLDSASSAPVASAPAAAVVSGCIAVASRCSCFDTQGVKSAMPADYCTENSASKSEVPKQVIDDRPSPPVMRPGDVEALAFLHNNRP